MRRACQWPFSRPAQRRVALCAPCLFVSLLACIWGVVVARAAGQGVLALQRPDCTLWGVAPALGAGSPGVQRSCSAAAPPFGVRVCARTHSRPPRHSGHCIRSAGLACAVKVVWASCLSLGSSEVCVLASLQLGFCCSTRCWPGCCGSAAPGLHAAGSGTCARSRIAWRSAILLCRGSAFWCARLRAHAQPPTKTLRALYPGSAFVQAMLVLCMLSERSCASSGGSEERVLQRMG